MSIVNDLVEDLQDWGVVTNRVQGEAHLVMLSGRIFIEAADEIRALRAALQRAVGQLSTYDNHRSVPPTELYNHFIDEARREQVS